MHAGQVRRDDNGYFGEALDIACRLLDAPEAKAALKAAPDPLLLIVSSHIRDSLASRAATGREHAAAPPWRSTAVIRLISRFLEARFPGYWKWFSD